jgi:hypothetical protein
MLVQMHSRNGMSRNILTTSHIYSISTQEPIYVLYEDNIKLNESRATSINKVIDLATTTVVRYVEKMLKIQIVEISIDFVS